MLELLSLDSDNRLKSYCVNARASYEWFLDKVRGAERNLEIQRDIIKGSKAYATLREDLKRGCLLPPLVLAVKNIGMPSKLSGNFELIMNSEDEKDILLELYGAINDVSSDNVYIIDGLQRTNALKQTLSELQAEGTSDAFLQRRLRLEFWLNIPFGALAYRMLLLNAGQKPMSIKHQVEILSMKLQEELSSITGITILTSLGSQRRTQRGQFHLSKLSQAFQAWLQGQPNVELRNVIMEQLLAESAIETLGASLTGEHPQEERDLFKDLVEWFVAIDCHLPEAEIQFLANETVLQGIAAAVGAAERNLRLQERKERCLANLLSELKIDPDSDPLGINEFELLRKGIDSSKVNVGQATREMVFRAFQEYFISDATKSMKECWRFAAGS